MLGDFGEEMSGGGHGGVERAKEVIMRHIGAQPAPNLLLQIELGGVAGQRRKHKSCIIACTVLNAAESIPPAKQVGGPERTPQRTL